MRVFCVKCGSENPEHAEYCYKCGKPIWQPASTDKSLPKTPIQNPTAGHPFLGKTCPYCQAPFKDEADVVLCKDCNMPHHRECWAENGNKCTTFGCAGHTALSSERSISTKSSAPLAREPVIVNLVKRTTTPSNDLQAGRQGNERIRAALKGGAILGAVIGAAIGNFDGLGGFIIAVLGAVIGAGFGLIFNP